LNTSDLKLTKTLQCHVNVVLSKVRHPELVSGSDQ